MACAAPAAAMIVPSVAHLDEQVRRGEGESDVTVSLEAQMPKGFGG